MLNVSEMDSFDVYLALILSDKWMTRREIIDRKSKFIFWDFNDKTLSISVVFANAFATLSSKCKLPVNVLPKSRNGFV